MEMMMIIAIGLLVGSFLNVCIYRIPRGESIVFGSSHCMQCGKKIKSYDLIPVVSYLFLRGKCRNCEDKISIRYPFIELLNAMLYLGIYHVKGLGVESYIFGVIASLMIVIAFIDYDHQIIPDRLSILTAIVGLGYKIWLSIDAGNWEILNDSLIAAVVVFLIFYILMVVSKGGMGGGDVKLIFGIGLIVGLIDITYVVLISSIVASIYGVSLMLFSDANRKTPIPFGTFLAIGTYIMMIF